MLYGDRVTLRPVQASDLPEMRRWFDDPETMRFWGIPRPFVTERPFEQDLQGRFASFETAGYFTIVDPQGMPIGRIDFERLDETDRFCELGILIGAESARGQGYGPDAIKTLLRYLFCDRGLHRAELTVLNWNERAIRAYRRLGFVEEGRLRDYHFVNGSFDDELQMSILRGEYEALHGACRP